MKSTKLAKMDEKHLLDHISKLLNNAGLEFEREPAVGGLRPDFIVYGPEGKFVIVEAKAWNPHGGNTARAWNQVEAYKRATGADQAFLVIGELKKNFGNKGVVNVNGLVPALREYFSRRSQREMKKELPRQAKEKLVFAAMPFSREYDDTYFVAMAYAAKKVDASCKRVDKEEFTGDIVEEIKILIRKSIAVIVDLSESMPDVLYEAGYAHALDKPAVHVCSTPLSELPFDVRNWNTIEYSHGQTVTLKEPLARRLKSVLEE
ncbi:MAG: hypothetical protein KAT65_08750 [Methanophagales archaeon]|nr:hypothetical protein [Methanophagales archaeon]